MTVENNMAPEFVIRRAELEDVDAMAVLLRQLFELEKDFQHSHAVQSRALSSLVCRESATVLVATKNNRTVGMVSVQYIVSTAMGDLSGWVEDLVVDSPERGKGVGTLLLNAIEADAREKGASRLQLLADKENNKALQFYHDHKWEENRMIPRVRFLQQPA